MVEGPERPPSLPELLGFWEGEEADEDVGEVEGGRGGDVEKEEDGEGEAVRLWREVGELGSEEDGGEDREGVEDVGEGEGEGGGVPVAEDRCDEEVVGEAGTTNADVEVDDESEVRILLSDARTVV